MQATYKKHLEVTKLLLDRGSDIEAVDNVSHFVCLFIYLESAHPWHHDMIYYLPLSALNKGKILLIHVRDQPTEQSNMKWSSNITRDTV